MQQRLGKSTLLRLAFHLLSASNNKGHRSALYEVRFESLEIDLMSGHTLSASFRDEKLLKILTLTISLNGEVITGWDYAPKRRQNELDLADEYVHLVDGKIIVRKRRTQNVVRKGVWGEAEYLRTLRSVVPATYILSADRRLDSDEVANPSDEIEFRRLMHYEEAKSINDLFSRSREIALTQALSAAGKWMSKKALQSANQGTENVHSVYNNVLRHLSATTANAEDQPDFAELVKQLTSVETRSAEYANYELAATLSTAEFRKGRCCINPAATKTDVYAQQRVPQGC